MPAEPGSGFINPYADKKRKKASQQPGSQVTPPGTTALPPAGGAPGAVVNPVAARVSAVEKASAGTFPTDVTWAMANLNDHEANVVKSTSILARQFDVPHAYIFGNKDPATIRDPYTGEMGLSNSTMQRLTNNYAPQVVLSMVKNSLTSLDPASKARLVHQGVAVPKDAPSAQRLANVLKGMAPAMKDWNLNAVQALGLALYVAQTGVNVKTFINNLNHVHDWAAATNQGPYRASVNIAHGQGREGVVMGGHTVGGFDYTQALSISLKASIDKQTFRDQLDVVNYMLPKELKDKVAAENTSYQNAIPALRSSAPGTAPADFMGTQTQGDATYQKNQLVDELTYNEFAPDFWTASQQLADKIQMEQDAFARSWFGRNVAIPVGKFMNTIWKDTEKLIMSNPITGGIVLYNKELFDTTVRGLSAGESLREAQGWRSQVFTNLDKGIPLGNQLAESAHLPDWMGTGIDFAMAWYLDPTVILGKSLAAARAARLLPELEKSTSLTERLIVNLSKEEAAPNLLKSLGTHLEERATARAAEQAAAFANSIEEFSTSKISQKMLQSIAVNADEKAASGLHRVLDRLRTNVGKGLDDEYMSVLKNEMRKRYPELADGVISDAAKKEWTDAIKAHFLGYGPDLSPAAEKAAKEIATKQVPKIGKGASGITINEVKVGGATKFEVKYIESGIEKSQVFDTQALAGNFRTSLERTVATPEIDTIGRAATREATAAEQKAALAAKEPSIARKVVLEKQRRLYEATHNVGDLKVEEVAGKRWTPQESGLLVPQSTAADLEHSAMYGENITETGYHVSFGEEVPRYKGIGREYGPRRATREFLTSESATETALGRKGSRLIGYNPGRMLNVHDAPGEYAYLHARRSGMFTEVEARDFQNSISAAATMHQGTDQVALLMDQHNELAFQRYLSSKIGVNADREVIHELFTQMNQPVSDYNRTMQTFGAVPKPTAEGDILIQPADMPLFESQLSNQLLVADPIRMQQEADKLIATQSKYGRFFQAALKKEGVTITTQDIPRIMEQLGTKTGKDFLLRVAKDYRRTWKVLTVARPGYIPRVILGDENLRFLITTGGLTDRLAAMRWTGEDASRILWGKLPLGIGGTIENAPLFSGFSISDIAKMVDEKGLLDEVIKVGDEAVTVARAGSHSWAYEPLVSNKLRESELLNDATRNVASMDKYAAATRNYDILAPTDINYYQAWNRALTQQIANSTPGNIALQYVKQGKTISETTDRLLLWAKEDHYRLLYELGWDKEAAAEWADTVSRMVHSYTMGDSAIADAALNRVKDLDSVLRAIPREARDEAGNIIRENVVTAGTQARRAGWKPTEETFGDFTKRKPQFRGVSEDTPVSYSGATKYNVPDVHGPKLEMALNPDNAASSYANWAYKTFVSHPEDVLNRQPYYRVWKARAERGYLRMLEASGEPLTDATKRAIDNASRSFALNRVRDIMFEYTKSSRLTELMQFVFPFPQPFFEGFQVWGHLAVTRPQFIGHAQALFRLGEQTGFITKNQDGEYVIPMGTYMRGARMLSLLAPGKSINGGLGDYSFFTSITSLNLLANSTLKLPSDGITGRIAGGMPIPFPGFDPLAGWVVQGLANINVGGHSLGHNDTLMSYLHQFGPIGGATFVPPALRNILRAVMPSSGSDDYIQSVADNIMKVYMLKGVDKYTDTTAQYDPSLPVSATNHQAGQTMAVADLAALANHDAHELLLVQGVMSLFSPGSLRVTYPDAQLNQELNDLIDEKGSVSQGIEAFNQRYSKDYEIPDGKGGTITVKIPMYPLETIGKTFFNQGYTDPLTGDVRNAPRLPTSQYVSEMFKQPGMQAALHAHPQWAALFLVGLDSSGVTKFDFSTFSTMVQNHMLDYKSSSRYWGEGQNAQVWTAIDAYYKQVYDPQLQKLQEEGVSTTNVAYTELATQRRDFFTQIYHDFPDWAMQNLKQYKDGQWDWNYEDTNSLTANIILHDARMVAAMPGYENFPGVMALNGYLRGRDSIEKNMKLNGVTDIHSDQANALGFTKQYNDLVSRIETKYPDFSPFIQSYFKDDLTGYLSAQGTNVANLPKELRAPVSAFDAKLESIKLKGQQFDSPHEKYQMYQNVRAYMNREYAAHPEVVGGWLQALYGNPVKLQKEREYLAGLPTAFYSRADWSVMGVKMTDTAGKYFTEIGQARVTISKYEDQTNGTYDAGAAYDNIDAFVRQRTSKGSPLYDASFAEAVRKTNTWGWQIQASGLTDIQGSEGRAWSNVVAVVQKAQQEVDRQKISPYSADYGKVRNEVLAAAKRQMKTSPEFEKHWYALQGELSGAGDGMAYLLVPEFYFPLGG